MTFRISVLGSGTIIPTKDRYATSLLVEIGGERLLLDCAPCSLNSLERLGFSFHAVDRIFFSHFHPDHTLGLGHLMAAINQLPEADVKRLTLYGPSGLKEFVRNWQKLYPSVKPKHDYLVINEIDEGPLNAGALYHMNSLQVRHSSDKALAYRIEAESKILVYTGDTELTASLKDFARGCDLLISECSFSDGSRVEGHMTPSDVAELASEASAKEVLLVHMYPDVLRFNIEAVIKNRYKGDVHVGYDSLQITI